MILKTERLILRPWREQDAPALYEYARDELVGPIAGWPVHTSVENSREIIKTVLSEPDTFAVTLRAQGDSPVGSIGLFETGAPDAAGEYEVGYWIGVPFWGRGLIPEAVRELQRLCFEERGAQRVWCSHFIGNERSRRVIDKCGFRYALTKPVYVKQQDETRDCAFYALTRAEWEARR